MAQYKSFTAHRKKLQQIWEQNQLNFSEITDNVKVIDVDYDAQTALKDINVVTLLDDVLLSSNFAHFQFSFADFPAWAINMAKPMLFMRFDPGWNVIDEKPFVSGEVELNDISIIHRGIETWWTQIDNTWRFNILYDLNPRFASSVSMFGFSTQALPTYVTAKLYIVNERNYNAIQSGK